MRNFAFVIVGWLAMSGAAAAEEAVTTTARPAPDRDRWEPLGFAGAAGDRADGSNEYLPIEDRWRIGFPTWDRYPGKAGEYPYRKGSMLNPYDQNVLKADYPIIGDDLFLDLTLASDTIFEPRSFPIPSGPSTENRRQERFFGDFDQILVNQNFIVSAEFFKGDTAFRPKDWAIRATAVGNINFVDFDEHNAVNADVRDGDDRLDGHIGMQELFIEYHLLDLSPNYDFLTTIAGIQPFTSDFRGFVFSDNNLGLRMQVNGGSNRYQANFAWFHQLDKDTNSGLNEFELRQQNVFIANFFAQDVLDIEGYTALFSYHYNRDRGNDEYDDNGFLVRPAKIGAVTDAIGNIKEKNIDAHYLGFGSDGHIGRLNLMHQYYFVFGDEENNEISGRDQKIQAHFFAMEPSVDVDWLRFKLNFLWQSGDRNPFNGSGRGFDSIIDNPFFAGSGFSYFNRQNIPFVQTGVQLKQRLSLLNNLRTSKLEGQSNFVNPGLFLYGTGFSGRITPKLFFDANVNALMFAETEVLEVLQQQNDIERWLGLDYSVGFQYRPILTENIIVNFGLGFLSPFEGFKDIYRSTTLYSGFVALTLTY